MPDPHRHIASLHAAGTSLHLDTTDLCFLLALRVRGDRSTLAAFEEEVLFDVYEQVCDLTDPGAASPRKRATHALQRLREQRLLSRVDGAGLVRAGDYAMTRLGTAIVDFFLEDEVLTRESLTVLTKTLLSQLTEITRSAADRRAAARHRERPHRRHRASAARPAEEVRARIVELLQRDWFGAVEACESLLDDTASTLRELNEVLLQDAAHLQTMLGEIEQQVEDDEATAAVQGVMEQVDRVSAWGGARLGAWSEYFQFVQRYLRSVVRLDPDRALSQRLRDQLAGWTDRPFFLCLPDSPPCRMLRETNARALRPPVTRPAEDREQAPDRVEPDPEPVALEQRVQAAVATGRSLSEVLTAVLPTVPDPYRATGRIADQVSAACKIHRDREPAWTRVPGALEVEEWTLRP